MSEVKIKVKENHSPYKYHILASTKKRHETLKKIIKWHAKQNKTGKKYEERIRDAAISKKKHLNVLRIYRKNTPELQSQIDILTNDMSYLDKVFNLGDTKPMYANRKSEKALTSGKSCSRENACRDSKYESKQGMLTTVWGPPMWHTLHTITFNYPVNPTSKDKKNYGAFFRSLENILPCGKCRDNLRKNLKQVPFTYKTLESRHTLSRWMYNLHNVVNRMLCKPTTLTYDKVRDRFEQFRATCVPKKQNKRGEMVESGCTKSTKKLRKCKCILRIVPQSKNYTTFKLERDCLCSRNR